jgi:transcriptional regulator with XRE-family HTH domain
MKHPVASTPERLAVWITEERERRKWTKVELGRKVGVTGPAIGMFESGSKRPRPEVLEKLVAIFGDQVGAEETDQVDLGGIEHVPDSLGSPPAERMRVGVPSTWDAAALTSAEPILFANRVDCEFDFLPGWGIDPLEHLGDERYDAILHNRFLISSARKTYRNIDVRMFAPLYAYQGQFVFVRREYVEDVLCRGGATRDQEEQLRRYLDDKFNVRRPETLEFPRLLDPSSRALLLDGARFAYVPGTDLEEAIRQLYDAAVPSERPRWLERDPEADTCRALVRDHLKGKGGDNALAVLFKQFLGGEYDVFCGGLAHVWELESYPDQYLTICDPKELSTPSLNGIIALHSTAKDRGEALGRMASSFYTWARLFKNWYQSVRIRDVNQIDPLRSGLHLRSTFQVADLGKPLDLAARRGVLGEGEIPEDGLEAWAWARLMIRYVDFFTTPREANMAALDPEARNFASRVSRLADRFLDGG